METSTSTRFGIIALAILIVSLMATSAWGYLYQTIYNPFTGKMDYYSVYTSSDPLNATNGTFSGGIIIGGTIGSSEGAMKYVTASKQFQGYNSTDWIALSTGGTGDTTCNLGQGFCNLVLYTNNATDGYLWAVSDNGTFVRKDTWTSINDYPAACGLGSAVRQIGDTSTCLAVGNSTSQMWTVADNGTFAKGALGNTTAQIWTVVDNGTFAKGQAGNTSAQIRDVINNNGMAGNVVYQTNTTNWDKNEADDFYINGSRGLTGNLNLTTKNITNSWGGANLYYNGTCWMLQGQTSRLEIC